MVEIKSNKGNCRYREISSALSNANVPQCYPSCSLTKNILKNSKTRSVFCSVLQCQNIFSNSCISFERFFFSKSRVLFEKNKRKKENLPSIPSCDTMAVFEYFSVHTYIQPNIVLESTSVVVWNFFFLC